MFKQQDRAWLKLLIETCTCLHALINPLNNFEVLVAFLLFKVAQRSLSRTIVIFFFTFLKHFDHGKGEKIAQPKSSEHKCSSFVRSLFFGVIDQKRTKKKLISKQLNELATCNVPIAFHRNASKYTEWQKLSQTPLGLCKSTYFPFWCFSFVWRRLLRFILYVATNANSERPMWNGIDVKPAEFFRFLFSPLVENGFPACKEQSPSHLTIGFNNIVL